MIIGGWGELQCLVCGERTRYYYVGAPPNINRQHRCGSEPAERDPLPDIDTEMRANCEELIRCCDKEMPRDLGNGYWWIPGSGVAGVTNKLKDEPIEPRGG